jgi:chromosomal replication initiator protein
MTPHVSDIQAAVCQRFQIAPLDMVSHRLDRTVTRARQLAIYLSRQMTPLTLPSIGRLFGDRDHTTVIHAIRATEKRIQADREFANLVARLRWRIAHPGEPPLPFAEC